MRGLMGRLGFVLVSGLLLASPAIAQSEGRSVRLSCQVMADGGVSDCQTVDAVPGDVDGRYSEVAVSRVNGGRAGFVEGTGRLELTLAIDQPLPMRAPDDRHVADPRPRIISNPQWDVQPQIEWPERLIIREVEGSARVRCGTLPDGTLQDCEILDEDPLAVGFGTALLAAARTARLSQSSIDSAEPGAFVELFARFAIGEDGPPDRR